MPKLTGLKVIHTALLLWRKEKEDRKREMLGNNCENKP